MFRRASPAPDWRSKRSGRRSRRSFPPFHRSAGPVPSTETEFSPFSSFSMDRDVKRERDGEDHRRNGIAPHYYSPGGPSGRRPVGPFSGGPPLWDGGGVYHPFGRRKRPVFQSGGAQRRQGVRRSGNPRSRFGDQRQQPTDIQ